MLKWSRSDLTRLEQHEQELRTLSNVNLVPERVHLSSHLYLHCHTSNEPDKPLMVLLHGYAGSGMCFFTILEDLSVHFNLYLVDLLGMGRSSRPQFTCSGIDDSEAFFVESLEELRQLKGFQSFVLLGHSFGGYIGACYYMRFPQYVNSLVFLSPVGFNKAPEDYIVRGLARVNWPLWLFFKIAKLAWDKHFSPLCIFRHSGPLSKCMMWCYSRLQLTNLPSDFLCVFEQYLEQLTLLPGSGEYAITQIFLPGAWASQPMSERLQVSVPTIFLYGDQDWMTPEGAYLIKASTTHRVEVKVVKNASHQLFWDNPADTARAILKFFSKLGTA